MVELMNRSRGFAEGVVVMICPVLLSLALDKVDLNREVYGRVVPVLMLVIASVTLISGICPLLACCFLKWFPAGCPGVRSPAPVVTSMASVSSTCLLSLASWMAQLVVSRFIAISIGVLFGACVIARTINYCCTHGEINAAAHDDADQVSSTRGEINAAAHDDADQWRGILDSSLEFLSGVTGILFLGLEGLALEGHNQVIKGHGRQFALDLDAPMGTVFFFCAFGVSLMLLEMIPPLRFDTVKRIVNFTLAIDGIMVTGTLIVLVVVMAKLMGPLSALLLLPPVIILLEYTYRVLTTGGVTATAARREPKPASLELTRVTFTGFLAMSVTAISSGSPGWLTNGFLLFAAAAIVSGLSWRLLSQEQIRTKLEGYADRAYPDGLASSANLASFCTHLCIVIATVLFAVMAGKAGHGHGHGRGEQESAPAPAHVGAR